MYYAIQWTYGRASNSKGKRVGDIYSFRTKITRDDFVYKGAEFTTEPNFREKIAAGDPEIRAAKKHGDKIIPWSL